jgi:regulatory protein
MRRGRSPAGEEEHARAPRRRRAGPEEAQGTPLERARAMALRVLAFHARTEAQLRARLDRAGLADQVDEVLPWLRRLGYVDDTAWARARARALLAARSGPRRVEERLRAAGIPAAAARAAVSEAVVERAGEGGGELALCRAALSAKLRGADPDDLDERARARAARFLLGRGFSGAVVARALGLRQDLDG